MPFSKTNNNTQIYPVVSVAGEYFSTNNVTFIDLDGVSHYCEPLLLNIPSIKESIDIESRKFQVGRLKLIISDSKGYSETIPTNLHFNEEVVVYFVDSSHTKQVFRGLVRDITQSLESVTVFAEDYSEKSTHITLPAQKSFGDIPVEYRNVPIPMVYGKVKRSPAVPIESYGGYEESEHHTRKLLVDYRKVKEFNQTEEQIAGITFNKTPLYLHSNKVYTNISQQSSYGSGDNFEIIKESDGSGARFLVFNGSDFSRTNSVTVEVIRRPSKITYTREFHGFHPMYIHPTANLQLLNDNAFGDVQPVYIKGWVGGVNKTYLNFEFDDIGDYNCRTFAVLKIDKEPAWEQNPSNAFWTHFPGGGTSPDIDPETAVAQADIDTYTSGIEDIEIHDWNVSNTYNSYTVGVPKHLTDYGTYFIQLKIEKVYIYQELRIPNVIEQDFYMNVDGRVNDIDENGNLINPNLSDDELLENPVDIIYDIVKRELGHDNINEDSYSKAKSEHDWEFAFSVTEEINSKKLIEDIAKSTKLYPRFNSNGEFVFDMIKSNYYPEDYDDAIIIKESDVIDFQFSRTKPDKVYKSVDLRFGKDYATNKYKYSYGLDETTHYDDNGKDYIIKSDYIQGTGNPVITVTDLHKYLYGKNKSSHLIIDLNLPVKYMDLELGDVIRLDKLLLGKKAFAINYVVPSMINGQMRYPLFKIITITRTIEKLSVKLMQLHSEISTQGHFELWTMGLDPSAPVITLNGESEVIIPRGGGNYVELGATALDDRDGEIGFDQFTVDGEVPIDDEGKNVIGVYYITYTVSDVAGNQASAIRTVTVVPPISFDGLVPLTEPLVIPLTINLLDERTLHFVGLEGSATMEELFYDAEKWITPEWEIAGSTYLPQHDVVSYDSFGVQSLYSNEWDKFIVNVLVNFIDDPDSPYYNMYSILNVGEILVVERYRYDYTQGTYDAWQSADVQYPEILIERHTLKDMSAHGSEQGSLEEVLPYLGWESEIFQEVGPVRNFLETSDFFKIRYPNYEDQPQIEGTGQAIEYNPPVSYIAEFFQGRIGDINQDGSLNILDCVKIVNTILGIDSQYSQESYPSNADTNQDGYLNILDVVELVNILLYGHPQGTQE